MLAHTRSWIVCSILLCLLGVALAAPAAYAGSPPLPSM
jgi:hypothetical protein